MIAAIILSLFLVSTCTILHYECLKLLNLLLPRTELIENRAKVLAVLGGALVSHMLQITLFALCYHLLRNSFGLGGFNGDFRKTFSSLFYLSAETYTSLGMGDIYPTGPLRLIVGIEALTGLLMIGWTSSFTYLEMRRYWDTRLPGAGPDQRAIHRWRRSWDKPARVPRLRNAGRSSDEAAGSPRQKY